MAAPINDKKAAKLNSVMSETMNHTSPRHVLRWLEMFTRNRAELMEVAQAGIDKASPEYTAIEPRLHRNHLIANGLKALLTSLDEEKEDDGGK
jgi:hypothetical protein